MNLSQRIKNQNKNKWIRAVICVGVAIIILFIYEFLSHAEMIKNTATNYITPKLRDLLIITISITWWRDVFVEAIIILLVCGNTWYLRGDQKADLYTEVLNKSTFELEHFNSQLENEIKGRKIIEKAEKEAEDTTSPRQLE